MKIFGIIAGVIVGLILLLAALAPTIAESLAFKNFPPAERAAMKAQYKKWRTEPIHLPAAALEAKPYSEEIKTAAKAFDAAWEKYKDRAEEVIEAEEPVSAAPTQQAALEPSIMEVDPITGKIINENIAAPGKEMKKQPTLDQAGIARALVELAPLTDAFTAVVRHPEYQVGAFASQLLHTAGNIPEPNFLSVQTSAKLLRTKALAEMREGRIDAALRDAETIVASAKTGSYNPLINQLIGIAICAIGTKTCNEIVQQCSDPALLRRTLGVQIELARNIHYLCDAQEDASIIDNIGVVREAKRRGVTIEYQDLTGRQLAGKSQEAAVTYLEQKVLPFVGSDPDALKSVQLWIKNFKRSSPVMGGRIYSISGLLGCYGNRLVSPTFFAMSAPNNEEARSRANTALSKFDLRRLATARKLYTLEKGKAPASNEALVPDYLPELPTDRHAREKTLYRMAGEVCYSIGPDGKDDKNQITYDPSNGTMSAGDIALK